MTLHRVVKKFKIYSKSHVAVEVDKHVNDSYFIGKSCNRAVYNFPVNVNISINSVLLFKVSLVA